MAPRISAVIDNRNYGRFLGQAIESVLAQDYPGGVECVVADDGSTDESRAVIASFGARVKAVLGEPRGQASAFNAGFAAATGDIICLLDSDDFWTKDKARKAAAAFEDPAVGAVEHRLQDTDAAGAPIPRVFPEWPARYRLEDFLDRRTQFGATSGIAFRRGVLDKILPLPADIFYYLDDLLLTKAMFHADVANIPEVLGFHRIHGANHCALGLRDPAKLELDLRMRAIYRREIDPLLAGRGLARSSRAERLEDLEIRRRRILLHAERGERGRAFGEWLGLVGAHGASRFGLFRAATCALAVASPSAYLRLYESYESGGAGRLRAGFFPD
ncbi:MAG TPA: glycosyltransferase [Elusimicrobiota bacterium]|jgi:glycosyltransferase involved in cell wall biosynthesis|nr:glycosyltransferase [Elusimicrobiota bacterium]